MQQAFKSSGSGWSRYTFAPICSELDSHSLYGCLLLFHMRLQTCRRIVLVRAIRSLQLVVLSRRLEGKASSEVLIKLESSLKVVIDYA